MFDEAERAQESGGLHWYRALTLINRGVVEHASRDEERALASFRRAAEIAEATDNERFRILARFHEAAAMAVLGEPVRALSRSAPITVESLEASLPNRSRVMVGERHDVCYKDQ